MEALRPTLGLSHSLTAHLAPFGAVPIPVGDRQRVFGVGSVVMSVDGNLTLLQVHIADSMKEIRIGVFLTTRDRTGRRRRPRVSRPAVFAESCPVLKQRIAGLRALAEGGERML